MSDPYNPNRCQETKHQKTWPLVLVCYKDNSHNTATKPDERKHFDEDHQEEWEK